MNNVSSSRKDTIRKCQEMRFFHRKVRVLLGFQNLLLSKAPMENLQETGQGHLNQNNEFNFNVASLQNYLNSFPLNSFNFFLPPSIPSPLPTPDRSLDVPQMEPKKRRLSIPSPIEMSQNPQATFFPQSIPRDSSKPSKKKNIPATIPEVMVRDGVEWIKFTYESRGLPKTFEIRTDIDDICLEDIPHDFKLANCVYTGAFCPKSEYRGNRWDYETSANMLGWKLCWLNKDEIGGKKGIIQRAVDSFRNRFPELRSRRVVRQEKFVNGVLRRRGNADSPPFHNPTDNSSISDNFFVAEAPQRSTKPMIPNFSCNPKLYLNLSQHSVNIPGSLISAHLANKARNPKSLALESFNEGGLFKIRIRVDIESIVEPVSERFRQENAVFPRAAFGFNAFDQYMRQEGMIGFLLMKEIIVSRSTNIGNLSCSKRLYEQESFWNEISWRLAFLNRKVVYGKQLLLQKALDVYKGKFFPNGIPGFI